MNQFVFTPDGLGNGQIQVPFFEEARKDFAPHYASEQSIASAKNLVLTEMAKLGGGGFIQDGHFLVNGCKRYGFRIEFSYSGAQGLIRVAGLPLKGEERPRKINQVRVQALMNVRDWLKAAVTSQVFSPGANVLIPFLLVDGQHTIMDHIVQSGRLPQLNPPPVEDVVEGELIDA